MVDIKHSEINGGVPITPIGTDVVVGVDDPGGTPANAIFTLASIGDYIDGRLQNNLAGTTIPLANDDSSAGYSVGSIWKHNDSAPGPTRYICEDATVGAAVWVPTTVPGFIPATAGGPGGFDVYDDTDNSPFRTRFIPTLAGLTDDRLVQFPDRNGFAVLTDGDTFVGPIDWSGAEYFGLNIQQMSTASRDLLTPGQARPIIWNTTTQTYQSWDGANWLTVGGLPVTAPGSDQLAFYDFSGSAVTYTTALDGLAFNGTTFGIDIENTTPRTAFGAGDKLLIWEAGVGNRQIDYSDLPSGSGISNLVEDTTPQLGGNLDLNTFQITGLVIGTDVQAHSAVLDATTASFLTADETKLDGIAPEATANATDAELATAGADEAYERQTSSPQANSGTTLTLDLNTPNQNILMTANCTLAAPTLPAADETQSGIILITQDAGTAFTLAYNSASIKVAGGAIDISELSGIYEMPWVRRGGVIHASIVGPFS